MSFFYLLFNDKGMNLRKRKSVGFENVPYWKGANI